MTTATQLLHAYAGAPQAKGSLPLTEGERCWLCAGPALRGLPVEDWQGANFTGQNRVRCATARYICEACVWATGRFSGVPGRAAGRAVVLAEVAAEGEESVIIRKATAKGWAKAMPVAPSALVESVPLGDKRLAAARERESLDGRRFAMVDLQKEPPRLGNVSHLYEVDGSGHHYQSASKGEKPLVLAFLRRPKAGIWFAAIAESGQKHVLPWTPVNPVGTARGRVLFEETPVALPESLDLVDEMAALLTAGASKDELGRGDYSPSTWIRCGDVLAKFEERRSRERHGAFWRLALFLAQRDEEATAQRMANEEQVRTAKKAAEKEGKRGDKRDRKKGDARGDGRVPRRGAERVPADAGSEPAQTLGHAVGAGAAGLPDERVGAGVGDDAGAGAETASPEQLGLFGAG